MKNYVLINIKIKTIREKVIKIIIERISMSLKRHFSAFISFKFKKKKRQKT